MHQRNFVNPAAVMRGRRPVAEWRRKLALAKALPYLLVARDTLGVIFLAVAYIWSRFTEIMALPMFYDEVIYLNYAREFMLDPQKNALISAEKDGKPPLFIWGLSWFWNLFNDPLAGGRFMSVLGGALTCIFIYLIGRRLFSSVVGFVATFFYIFSPLMILHNRLAVHSSWETAAGMGTLYFAIAMAQRPSAVYALGLGAAIVLGMFIKQTALFYFGLVPMVVYVLRRRPDIMAQIKQRDGGTLRRVAFWWYRLRVPKIKRPNLTIVSRYQQMLTERQSTTIWKLHRNHTIRRIKQWWAGAWRFVFMVTAVLAALILAGAAYLPLLTHPKGSYLSSTDTSYALTLPEVIGLPLDLWRGTLQETWSWYSTYYSYVILLLVAMAIGYALLRPKVAQAEMILLAWAILPILAQILLARLHWFSRYVVAFGPPLLLLAALALVRLSCYIIKISRERWGWSGSFGVLIGLIFMFTALAPVWRLNSDLINNPAQAQLAAKDRWQYIEGWPSGYGVEASVNYIRELAAQDSILLYIDQDNVTPEDYYHYYLDHLKGWVFYGRTPGVDWNSRNFQGERTTYYITTVQPDPVLQPYLKLMKSFPKPGGTTSIAIYHFVPPR